MWLKCNTVYRKEILVYRAHKAKNRQTWRVEKALKKKLGRKTTWIAHITWLCTLYSGKLELRNRTPSLAEIGLTYMNLNYLALHNFLIRRLLRQLGCSHGCTTALRGPQAECLRVQARNSLRQLRSASIPKFTIRLKEMTKYSPIREVLDNLHASVGFCAEPATMVSPMSE